MYWGVCVPSTCGPDDVSFAIKSVASQIHNVEVLVENDMCQVKRLPKPSTDFDRIRFWAMCLLIILASFGLGTFCTPDEIDRNCFK